MQISSLLSSICWTSVQCEYRYLFRLTAESYDRNRVIAIRFWYEISTNRLANESRNCVQRTSNYVVRRKGSLVTKRPAFFIVFSLFAVKYRRSVTANFVTVVAASSLQRKWLVVVDFSQLFGKVNFVALVICARNARTLAELRSITVNISFAGNSWAKSLMGSYSARNASFRLGNYY